MIIYDKTRFVNEKDGIAAVFSKFATAARFGKILSTDRLFSVV